MSERIDPTVPAILTMNPAVAAGYVLGPDGMTLGFTPASLLAPSTTYGVTVSGARDPSGNSDGAASWSFTRRLASRRRAPDAADQRRDRRFPGRHRRIAFEAADPHRERAEPGMQHHRVHGRCRLDCDRRERPNVDVPPLSACRRSSDLRLPQLQRALNDWAGNHFTTRRSTTAAPTVDATPPQVVSVTPFNNATVLGLFNPVTTFGIDQPVDLRAAASRFQRDQLVTASPSSRATGPWCRSTMRFSTARSQSRWVLT